jgi:hypothetical protein
MQATTVQIRKLLRTATALQLHNYPAYKATATGQVPPAFITCKRKRIAKNERVVRQMVMYYTSVLLADAINLSNDIARCLRLMLAQQGYTNKVFATCAGVNGNGCYVNVVATL